MASIIEVNHIYNIDCMDGFSKMDDNSVDYVFTSPPYNRKRNDKYTFYNDDMVDYKTFIKGVVDESLRVSKGHIFFNIQKNYYNKKDVFELIGAFSDVLVEMIIWNKTNPMPASGKNITNTYEYFLVMHKEGKPLKSNRTYTKNVITTSVYSNNPYTKIHKAVMHPEVAESIFSDYMKPKKIVLDPFMGVGTTAYVAKKFGLNYIGFEKVKDYVDIANQRLLDA